MLTANLFIPARHCSLMTPERWQEVEDVLQEALDRPAQERAAFLDQACAGDTELKTEAAGLIRAYEEAGDFIELPAIAQDARVIACDRSEANIGRVVGHYRIIEQLGAGGMGEVYLAEDGRLGRLVALKMLPSYFVSDDARLRRFQREARAASALNHPNILTIHEVGEFEDARFIATEFIDGETIRALVATQELSLEEVLDIAIQIALALAAAHAEGIVHRDIKPENIMRRRDGIVKILDFGIAKLLEQPRPEISSEARTIIKAQTEAGIVMGTVGYMSPEQARALEVDERTDTWSLGVLLYEMLAGRAPFASATRADTLVSILEREPAPLLQSMKDAPAPLRQLQQIVGKSLRKERSERYQTAMEMVADLKSTRQSLSLAAQPEGQHISLWLHALRKAGGRDGKPGPVAPESLASALHTSDATIPAAESRARWWRRPHIKVMLVAAALLVAVIAATALYRLSVARRDANMAQANATGKLYTQMSEAEQLAFINEQEQRISAMMGDRPAKLNEEALRAIKQYVDHYVARTGSTSNEFGKEGLDVIYARANGYVPLIASSFAARRVPVIIGIYLPMIESEYKPCFENSSGSKGLFQFLPQTARHYGVAPEDMCDVRKMTPAAAHYIADRMAELGDDAESMTLVLLSYNRGPEWVRDTLRQLRNTDNYERNFWTLFAHRDQLDATFRDENAGYVPKFFAAAIIGENPQNFGLQFQPLSAPAGPSVPQKRAP
jgi:serine/threonine protein kinase